ncbi:autoinducer binding domain-containing protein [Leucothrix arctica]|uniref:Transcription factor LuxR-like autoinducer-binding domain-containing protein n=1 Tax=Leucothrix arctica TaxID=1481894 RepID=A0A317C636_9GAMM|nr:autoinducer binding domain-containing protein [Leucothrix arctica]PWQ94096.1 hypothetical protein DKT75_16280 [Leucothrix arctica]
MTVDKTTSIKIGNFAIELINSKTSDEAFAVFDRFLTITGFDSVLYSYIPSVVLENPSHLQPVFQVSKNYDLKYLDHYTQAELHKHDHIINNIANGSLAELDWWQEAKSKDLSKSSLDVFNIAKIDHYMENGYTIPTLSGAQGIAAASFISSDKRVLFDQLLQEQKTLVRTVTTLFHNHIMSQYHLFSDFLKPTLPNKLNTTEQAILKHLCNGYRPAQIAPMVNKSERHTENVIRNIRIKFAGLNEEGKPRISTSSLIYHCGLLHYTDSV